MSNAPIPSDNDTSPSDSTRLSQELSAEQQKVDQAYYELDTQLAQAHCSLARIEAQGADGTHQARTERDAFASHYSQRISSLEGVEDRLVFGRMDLSPTVVSPDGSSSSDAPSTEVHYVGRIGLQDSQRHEVVLDWRAPMSRAFYQATASAPMGLLRRRHIATHNREVTGLEDELIDVEATTGEGAHAQIASDSLQGEGALFAAMSAAREGRMGDIVATIQAEQDRIVTAPPQGVLVVQGGPGTGKTAVALHRVAYLFYTERERLERSGVLLVGPSRTFLRYVEQVLPSLGETGVVSTTIGDLVPGLHAQGSEPAAVAELKGRLVWKDILHRAVRALQRIPAEPRPITVQGTTVQLLPADVREAQARARRSGKPHNLARETFVLWLLERLVDQYAQATSADATDPDTRAWIREDIRTSRDARREINLCWMPTTPVQLLERLWSRPEQLARLAPSFSTQECQLLQRHPGSTLTPADIPLVDELAELLGPSEDAEQRHAKLAARRREADVAYAAQAIESQELGDGLVTAEMLADRFQDTGPALTLAERARADRSWTYGHVVVDESQELGPMAWRALARRCPLRSFTVVGDLAQYSGPTAPRSWAEVLGALGKGALPQEEVLTVCYRTPATVMQAAENVLTGLGAEVTYPVRSVRDLPDCLEVTALPEANDRQWSELLQETVLQESALLDEQVGEGAGRIAIICSDPAQTAKHLDVPALAEILRAPQGDVLRARAAVMGPSAAKGLEYDAVIVVEPAELGRTSPGDLYVAMTRPTRRLRVVARSALPKGF